MDKPSKDDQEKLLTLAEVSALLDVPLTMLYAWRYRHEGPRGYKIGRHVRYRRDVVAAWLEAHADQWAA